MPDSDFNATKKSIVLVVDDDRDIRDTLSELLGFLGYDVMTVADRGSALNVLKKDSIEAVILDWQMPGMSIEEFLVEVRGMDSCPAIVLLTAGYNAGDKANELGLKHFVPKPFDMEVLRSKLLDSINALSTR